MLLNPLADFPLARALREPEGVPLGAVFAFLSGLYFRGKLAYASAFGGPAPLAPPALVVTTDRGLVSPEERVRPEDLEAFAGVDLGTAGESFRGPLRRDLEALVRRTPPDTRFVLLGSIATGKYADTMLDVLGDRLGFPLDFVGRGDMSRGGLMLRCVLEQRELGYTPVAGAVRRGQRPPRLPRLPR